MAKVAVTHKFSATADEVWAVIGGFHTLDAWHPAAVSSTDKSSGNDVIRDLELPDGGHVIERLEEFSNSGRSYTYSITGGIMPVEGYVAVLSVIEDDNGATAIASWTAEFAVVGADESETVSLVANDIFRAGLAAAAEKL
jgi:hypothetical protein